MKKIAIIFPKNSEAIFNADSDKTFGGASVQMYLIALEMRSYAGLEPVSIVYDYDTIEFPDKKEFTIVKSFRQQDPLLLKVMRFYGALRRVKPDIIIQHGLTIPSCLLALYCRLTGVKFVFMFAHDLEAEGRYQSSTKKCALFRMLLRCSHLLLTQNDYQQKTIKKKYGTDTHIFHNGFFIPKSDGKKDGTVLWVARSDRWKRPELFIGLAEMNPKRRFIMICPNAGDDDYYGDVRRKASSVPNIEFIPFVKFNEIDSYYRSASVFVNTSDYEGFPQTFLQSALHGTPIVSLNVNPDGFLERHRCGFYTNGDLAAMNEKIGTLLADKKLHRELSDNARTYAREHHDIRKNVKGLLGLIKQGG